MKKVADDIYQWSVFSEDKQLDFNGLWVHTPDGDSVIVDPPPCADDITEAIRELGVPVLIILTNKDHRRNAPRVRDLFSAPICIHELDAPLVSCDVDSTFSDDEVLAGVFEVIRVPDSKSPGESALYWRDRKLLILGDALIGKPAGSLSMLPDAKFADPAAARAGVAKLAELDVETVLVGDGVSIPLVGGEALRAFVGS